MLPECAIGWAVFGLIDLGAMMLLYWVERWADRQRRQLAKIELLEPPKQHYDVAEYDVPGKLYPRKLDSDLITNCPMVDAPGGLP